MFRRLLVVLVRTLLKPVMRILFRVRIEGTFDAMQAERLIIIANHESYLDGLLLGLFLPVKPVFVVHTLIARQPMFRAMLWLTDYLTVDPMHPMAVKQILALVKSGRPVVIFPEGRITVTGGLMKVYEGPAFVAARTGATLVPVRLDGPARSTFARLSGEARRQWFPQIRLSILPPTQLPMPEGATAKERRRRAGEAMRHIMQEMMFQSHKRRTLFEALVDAGDIHGWKTPIVEDVNQTPYTYRQVLKMALAAGRFLAREGEDGEHVGVLLPNLAITAGAIIGASAFGRIPAVLNPTAGADALRNALTAAQVGRVLTSRAFIDKANLQATLAALPEVKFLYLEDLRPSLRLKDKLWVLAASLWPARYVPSGNVESPAVVLFTSGSEGKPKGVVLSHRALVANVAQIRAIIDLNRRDRIFNALPMFHSFGLTAGTLYPLIAGVPVFLYVSPLHYRVIPEIVYDRNCTALFGTGTFLAHYGRFAHPYDFFRLRYVVAGAEKLNENVRTLWFEKFGVRIYEGYGATETAPVLAVNTPMAYRAGTVGQILPGIEHRLVPVPGIERGGQLQVRGPNVMSGYLRSDAPGVLEPPVTELGEGWYDTGDVVSIDADGFVRIEGRVKRFAKIAGEMISLEVVERMAQAANPTAQHAATSRPDAARGEALILFTTDRQLTRETLLGAAQQLHLPELAVPRIIRVVDELPMLPTGKVDYLTLKARASTEAPA
ncbi:MAG: bifunctional acyl-ACP--phospholipid O-acyltransferase/long-chain-fatty-acid--ACP ligase [Halothiobacillaceae bacterium]|nr:bifunctional acyl-ACP--phospholipid O-acyltransferase/long-chain-fatty-acid--ACP ligase [Halothiobacillaceae bacterium]